MANFVADGLAALGHINKIRTSLLLCLYIPNSSGNLNDVQAIYGKIAHVDSNRIPYLLYFGRLKLGF